jgi:saccharopine dehydrogenase-like NADP-dependent oxidoreductase
MASRGGFGRARGWGHPQIATEVAKIAIRGVFRSSAFVMKILVLGGAGAMGRQIVQELLDLSSANRVTVADTRCDHPPAWAKRFRRRLTLAPVDLLREPARLVRRLRGHDVMINATTHHLNLPAMRVALRAKVHYMDLGGLFHYTRKQLKLHRAFKRIGRLAILGMGCAPGMSNLLAVVAAEGMERVESIGIKVGGRSLARKKAPRGVVEVPYAIGTIREELTLRPWVFSAGRYRAVKPRSGSEVFRFAPPVGRQTVFLTLHSEVATLPASFQSRGVRDVSFKIGFEPPLIRALLARSWSLKFVAPSRIQDVEITCAVVRGRKAGRKVEIHAYAIARSRKGVSAGTMDTAIPPALVAGMLPRIRKAGVFAPEQVVEAREFFRRIRSRGIFIRKAAYKL